MPTGLKRYHNFGHDHFITFTRYHRLSTSTTTTPAPSWNKPSNRLASAITSISTATSQARALTARNIPAWAEGPGNKPRAASALP